MFTIALTIALTLLLLTVFAIALLIFVPRALPRASVDRLIDQVHALLPHTQCEQCGQPGCRPYATSVINGEAANLCAPGGEPVARAIAELLARPVLMPAVVKPEPSIARIRETECIGCARCIPACPVDAILGAALRMHTVLEAECTGCGLCIAPCPVDCIDLVPVAELQVDVISNNELTGAEIVANTTAAGDIAPLTASPIAAPCINCAACADVCPEHLQPQALFRLLEARNADAAIALGLHACTGCGACDTVCPSRIPLLARFGQGIHDAAAQSAARNVADLAGQRFTRHEQRRIATTREHDRKREQRLAGRASLASTDND